MQSNKSHASTLRTHTKKQARRVAAKAEGAAALFTLAEDLSNRPRLLASCSPRRACFSRAEAH